MSSRVPAILRRLSATARTRGVRPCTTLALFALLGTGSAHAGSSGSLSLTSDYIFRGISQSDQRPALQGGVELSAAGGAYAGAWGSSISWLSDLSTTTASVSSSIELDAYAGYRGKLADAVAFDVGAQYYAYPGDFPSGFNRADTFELYAGLTVAASDRVSLGAKYSLATTDLFGYVDSGGSGYLDLSATCAIAPGWALAAHAGRQWIEGNDAFEYSDWKLGVTRSFDHGASLGLAWSGTDADDALYTNPHGRRLARSTVALTLGQAF
ncbi:MAG: hypothetical protein I8H71_12340 [Xanthomonadaceae bacterium]|nr:hypothetical protein [Xanthomonadaceae bacterium]